MLRMHTLTDWSNKGTLNVLVLVLVLWKLSEGKSKSIHRKCIIYRTEGLGKTSLSPPLHHLMAMSLCVSCIQLCRRGLEAHA